MKLIKFLFKILFKFTPLGCLFKLAILGLIGYLIIRFVIAWAYLKEKRKIKNQ